MKNYTLKIQNTVADETVTITAIDDTIIEYGWAVSFSLNGRIRAYDVDQNKWQALALAGNLVKYACTQEAQR